MPHARGPVSVVIGTTNVADFRTRTRGLADDFFADALRDGVLDNSRREVADGRHSCGALRQRKPARARGYGRLGCEKFVLCSLFIGFPERAAAQHPCL